jgi:hypothetical protein
MDFVGGKRGKAWRADKQFPLWEWILRMAAAARAAEATLSTPVGAVRPAPGAPHDAGRLFG